MGGREGCDEKQPRFKEHNQKGENEGMVQKAGGLESVFLL